MLRFRRSTLHTQYIPTEPTNMVDATPESSASSSKPHVAPASGQSTALASTKQNLKYLVSGAKSGAVPSSFKTRSLLTTTRYILKYVFWRLVRYGKYAFVGGAIAVLGGGLLGTVGSGIAFFAAPSFGVGIGIGIVTALVKFGWRHRGSHFRQPFFTWAEERAHLGSNARKDEQADVAVEEARRAKAKENQQRKNDVWMRS